MKGTVKKVIHTKICLCQKEGSGWFYAEDKNNVLADAFGATRTPEVFLFDKITN